MMTSLRSQMKTILWILVFAFLATIVFSWGMGGFQDTQEQGILGKIDKQEIQFAEFEQYVQLQVNRASREGKDIQDQSELQRIREQAWDDYVERILKNADAENVGLKVTDREIAYIVQNYPPKEVQEADIFKRDGKFDQAAYLNFLRTPNASEFLLGLESSVRNYLLEQKALFQVMQSVSVTEQEVRNEFLAANTFGKLEFVAFLFKDVEFDSSQIPEEEMKRYYRMFPDRFKEYPQRRFAYVKFKLEPTLQDSMDVKRDAEQIIRELNEGADFAELAKEFSDDKGSGANGGDLGWFARGKMVNQFEDVAFNADLNEIQGPVLTRFGYHIIEVLDKRTGANGQEEINARHILVKIEPSVDTREDVYNQAYNFSQDVAENGFDSMVKRYEYKVDTTKAFSEAGYITGLGRMRMAAEFCFDNPVGTAGGVYQVPDGYVVFKIVEATEEKTKPYEEVRSTIQKTLVEIAQQNRAWTRAADFRAKVNDPAELEAAAHSAGLSFHVSEDSLKPNGNLPDGLRRDQEFLTEAFRLNDGEVSDVIKGRYGCYVARLANKAPVSEEGYKAAHSTIFQTLLARKQEAAVRNWVRELRVAADIKDMRYRFYNDF